ncbi:DUF2971 domain-containing protein [Simiduia sp. 21SJ11W-1]|uniref:DUF2971 domain-containing protein n=1 Tax=Simiduia sp. 21SJ11W-1 TaxID=2909669 RepID=UPI00209DDBA4|nr:DUF2971 domain-containing protein [Simiduia sp. 21SJ11W-1]UTA47242.1 DUF2971 domain-containing protein [Simiduia sp. 21SJ11W-1]
MVNHSPETLVKYCSVATATKILESQSLRWSAPNLYGDPFELNHLTALNFDPQSILNAAIQAATAMIFAKDEPRGSAPLAVVIRRWRDEERFQSPDEALDVLRELLSQMVDNRLQALDTLMADWRKFCRTLRVCSFTAKPDNLAAWTHYGDHHRGVAIRMQCGEFTSLTKPRQVTYRPQRPEITTMQEQLAVVLTNQDFKAQDHFFEKFTNKAVNFAHENEWRCFRQVKDEIGPEAKPEQSWFDDVKFERSDITAVYFGALTDPKVMRDIYALVQEKYSQAKVFQAKSTPGKYDIEFNRITR